MREQILLLRDLGVAVSDEEHGQEGKQNEDGTEGEEDVSHADEVVKHTREDGRDDLRAVVYNILCMGMPAQAGKVLFPKKECKKRKGERGA